MSRSDYAFFLLMGLGVILWLVASCSNPPHDFTQQELGAIEKILKD